MAIDRILILSKESIEARLQRMAYQIYEHNYHEEEVYIIGIDERGGYLADELATRVQQISDLKVHFEHASLDRDSDPNLLGIQLSVEDITTWENKVLIVVDDVLYTGKTLLNVVSILLQATPKFIQTAVLIDRGHRSMPVSADFIGLELATTLHQHVSVEIDASQRKVEAYLS